MSNASEVADRLKLDFEVFASGVAASGEKYMTEADLMQCFGVRAGHSMYMHRVKSFPAGAAAMTASSSETATTSIPAGITLEAFLLLAGVASAPKSSLQETFAQFDTNKDGYITLEDFKSVVQHASMLDVTAAPAASSSQAAGDQMKASSQEKTKSGWFTKTPISAAAESPALSFTERYFGKDGKGKVSYAQFADLVREMDRAVLKYKWLSMSPAADNTVSLVSFGRLLIKEAHELPPVLAKNLVAPENLDVRLSWDDFVAFDEVLENLDELEERLELEIESIKDGKGVLSHATFDEVVKSVSRRRILEVANDRTMATAATASIKAAAPVANVVGKRNEEPAATSSSSKESTVVMNTLFRWLDTDKDGALSKKEVAALLPLLQQQTTMSSKPPRPLALWESVVLGGISAGIAGTVMYPMDTVKARIMNGQGSSIVGAFRDVIGQQGFFALYRGLPAQLVGIMPEKAVKLTLYNGLRNWMMDKETQHATYTQEALAGLGTAVVQVLVTNPYELIKVRQQTVVGQPITETIRELGFKGLSQGMGACLMRDMPFNMMYFSSYAVLKDHLKPKDGSPLSPQSLMAAGLGAGLLAGSVTTPADVIKTRMQTDKTGRYKSLLDCMGKMWREEGPQAFMKGLGPRVMLIPPLFAITMTCFETLQRSWFPQTVASPGLKHLPADQGGSSVRATMTDMVKHKLEQLERNLALKPVPS